MALQRSHGRFTDGTSDMVLLYVLSGVRWFNYLIAGMSKYLAGGLRKLLLV
jgi:hypothetical protein